MSEIKVKQLAQIVGTPLDIMLKQLHDAGIPATSEDDSVTDEQKLKLLEFIRSGGQRSTTKVTKPKLSINRQNIDQIPPAANKGESETITNSLEKKENIIKEDLAEDGSKSGIESEEEEEIILDPFNPDSISIDSRVVPMETLKRRLKQKTIHLAPGFQRSEVWDLTRKSRLIESLMLKIPLPMFYVAANEKDQWDVVDGLQRLSTIRDFILGDAEGNKLKLKDLEFLGEKLNGKTIDDIENNPKHVRLINTIMETEMRFTVINPGTPETVKRNIFKRINTGGMPLTSQEIRHALYQGQSSDLLMRMVDTDHFKKAINGNINDSRMGAREIILRFFAFLIFPISSYNSDMDGFLSNTMRVINCMPAVDNTCLLNIFQHDEIPKIRYTDIQTLENKFILAMRRGRLLFSDNAFRKSLPDKRKTPINKSLFEVWSNILCELDENDFSNLLNNKQYFFEEYGKLLNTDHFVNAISRHASKKAGANTRYYDIKQLINHVLTGKQE